MGADTMRGAIQRFVPRTYFISRSRFSDLAYTGQKKLTRLPRRSAVVGFSAEDVYGIAELIRRQRGGAAVVLGALSPRTRNAQVQLYQNGDVDFLVATDAIGMGLNMDVDHVAFAALDKFDGVGIRPLRPEEIGQIAGRAGRHMNDGTFGVTAEAEPFNEEVVSRVEGHRYDPVRVLQWRNPVLDFHFARRADREPGRAAADPRPGQGAAVERPRGACAIIANMDDVREMTRAPGGCAAAVGSVPASRLPQAQRRGACPPRPHHLPVPDGRRRRVLPDDWLARQIGRLDVVEGDVSHPFGAPGARSAPGPMRRTARAGCAIMRIGRRRRARWRTGSPTRCTSSSHSASSTGAPRC